MCSGLDDVKRFQREVFSERRKADRGTRRLEVFQSTLKKPLVGENRDCSGSSRLVLDRNCGRIEVRRQQTLAGGRLLDLCNDRRPGGSQRVRKIPPLSCLLVG